MKLHWSPRSPFVRKVMVAAHERGVAARLDCVRTVAATSRPHAELMKDNPLSKIPTLVLDDGTVIYDSPVICEYFDAIPKQQGCSRQNQRCASWRCAVRRWATDFSICWYCFATNGCGLSHRKRILPAPPSASGRFWRALKLKRPNSPPRSSALVTSPSDARSATSIFATRMKTGANPIRALPTGTQVLRGGRRYWRQSR
jgi:hypothetical protein